MTRATRVARVRTAGVLLVVVAVASALYGCGHTRRPARTAAPPPPSPAGSPSPSPVRPVCPLTGAPSGGGLHPHRVALAVKIDNVVVARPQAGLDHADVVVEEQVEGGLTRLFAVFQCDSARVVGPIRSARPTDADLLAMLHGSVFAYSGANPRAIVPVRRHGDAVLIANDSLPQYFHRESGRPAPHNVFSSTQTLLRAGLARRKGLHAPPGIFRYGAMGERGRKASHVSMAWPAASAEWRWNGHVWMRTQDGRPDNLVGGRRVHATNVVVMSVALRPSGIRDVAGNETPNSVVVGRGTAWVFRNGRAVAGHWRRAGLGAPLRFYDESGAAVRLRPGRTWVELLPRPRRPTIR